MVVMSPPLLVKMPSPPASRLAPKATVPLSLREGKSVILANGPLLSAMVVMGPPLPMKIPPPAPNAVNATVPLSLITIGMK
jgi:hypothetical protein